MQYRSHVDGLRAIAITFVLLFHAGLSIVPSGFIGVDIFFVISGFLITSILHESLENSRFSFLKFYKRRLWRLQPVFICLVMVTTLVTLLFYLPDDLILYSKSARKTLLFISNKFFGRVTSGYFSPDSNQLPLLHTWSLSIEWQCYLMLPIAMYGIHRVFGRHLPKIIYLLTICSLILSLYISINASDQAYYRLATRIFEFLIGSCVALGPRVSFGKWNRFVLNSISTLALFTLFFIGTRHDIHTGFPNVYAIVLCIATGVLIACGDYNYKPLWIRLLSLKPIIFIGLLSYSLYIWHWPIFAFLHYLDFTQTYPLLLSVFAVLFGISYLSWRYIERPGRKMSDTNTMYTLLYLFIIPAVVVSAGDHFIKKYKGFPGRFAETRQVYAELDSYANKQRPLCLGFKSMPVDENCVLGARAIDSKKGFMIGDSFSNHYWNFIDVFAREANVSILAHSTGSCLALPGVYQYHWFTQRGIYDVCAEQTARYYRMIRENHYDYVIIGESWNGYLGDRIVNHLEDKRSYTLTQQRIAKGIDDALQSIIASGAKPVLIKAIALSPKGNPYACFFKHIKRRVKYNPEECDFDVQAKSQKWLNDIFTDMQKKYRQLVIIDPQAVLCTEKKCKADIANIPVFRDPAHLTDYASYQLAIRYKNKYPNPLMG